MKFNTEKEMYEHLINKGDLYNKITGHYVFEYNDAHALCVYRLTEDEMLSAAKTALLQDKDEHLISSVLGAGGAIFDNPEYDHLRYSEDENERALYLELSIRYCHDWYDTGEWVEADEFFTLANIEEVEELNHNTPDGQIMDADTILVDAITQCDYEFTGLAQDIFNIWKNSSDKKAVEYMFFEFTDVEFKEFLKKCKEQITK